MWEVVRTVALGAVDAEVVCVAEQQTIAVFAARARRDAPTVDACSAMRKYH